MSEELDPIVETATPVPTAEEKEIVAAEPESPAIEDIVEAKPVKPLPTRVTVPVAVDIEAVRDALPEPAGPAVVGNGEVDEVKLSACVYKNVNSQKSLTVYHLQRRLVELGFEEAGLDKQGYYGGATKLAVRNFQASKKFDATGIMDALTFKTIFKGDPNVKVIL